MDPKDWASMPVSTAMDSLSNALRSNIIPNQEYLLQGSVLDTAVEVLLHRLRGLCDNVDTGPETFHDHEMCFSILNVETGTSPQPLLLRVRRALDYQDMPWQLRYIGQPEGTGDKSRPTIVRSSIDIGTTSAVVDFLTEMGCRMDFEYIVRGYMFRKGRMKITVSKIFKMGQDDIILFEQKKKEALRARSSDDDEDCSNSRSSSPSRSQPEINMAFPNFPPPPENRRNMFNRKPVKGNQNNWTSFRRMNGSQMEIRKHYNGIPLISMKRRDKRPNSYMMWRQRCFGRSFSHRYFNPNQLTSWNLNRFNRQNPHFLRKGGPGSVGSRGSRAGSVCSNCSNASMRSNTSFRSNHSVGSYRSYNNRSRLSSNRSSQRTRFNRFICHLNLNIQKEIKIMQERKAIRVQKTSRENILDEPTKCKPIPRTTGVTFNHRFKQFIANPLDL